MRSLLPFFFFFQAEDGIRDKLVTGVQTCALPIFLYFTPALFPIYFRAAKQEASSYEPELQRRIGRERIATIAFQLGVLAIIAFLGGWWIAFKLYVVPVLFVFPIAFALNRVGQHYDIDPSDPAKWSTLVKGSLFWDAVYLFSNYHLEHHYFPGVPFYNLPRLQRLLMPFYEKRGMNAHGYGGLFWGWGALNGKPHSQWSDDGNVTADVSPLQP